VSKTCTEYGHKWKMWRYSSDGESKVRECSRCGKTEEKPVRKEE